MHRKATAQIIENFRTRMRALSSTKMNEATKTLGCLHNTSDAFSLLESCFHFWQHHVQQMNSFPEFQVNPAWHEEPEKTITEITDFIPMSSKPEDSQPFRSWQKEKDAHEPA